MGVDASHHGLAQVEVLDLMDPSALVQRLGGARVGLRRDLDVSRHMVGGEPSYVFHDPVAFRNISVRRLAAPKK